MKTRELIFTMIWLVTFSLVGQSQFTFKYGVEAGLAVSPFLKNKFYSVQSETHRTTQTNVPLYSPLIGLTTDLTIKKHLNLTAALQYQMTGQRNHYYREANDPLYNATYRNEAWENQTFHKLCFNLTAGLTLKVWKLQPTIFIGYRLNYFISAKHYIKSVYDHDDPAKDATYEYEINPLDKSELDWTVKRFHRQICAGFSTAIGKHLKISLSVNESGRVFYSESAISCLPYGFTNNDYLATVTYFLPTLKKRTDKQVTVK
jgi:hypothetical protein